MAEQDDIDIPNVNPIHHATGEAIEAYARVEQTLTSLLQALLKTDFKKAHAIFFAIQNVRSRNELLETLLELEFKGALAKHWSSLSRYLLTLAQFRNAIAHWHPLITIHVKSRTDLTGQSSEHALHHPAFRAFKSLHIKDFPPFLKDCMYAREVLSDLGGLVRERPDTLPERFQKPLTRRNLAVLQPSRSAKAQQPRRQPSRPSAQPKDQKLSAAQRRRRALGIAGRSKPKPSGSA